ncbi:MAG: hypothetical protein P1U88_06625 [Thalassobaculaceae bacterium]|nr:hypothetical protein [Thalassobaculaceae bacterium]
MNNLEIKRNWIAPEIVRELSGRCYQVAEGDFHKQNVLKLLTGIGGAEQAKTAREIVELFWKTPIPDHYEEIHKDRCALWLNFTTLRHHQVGRIETYVSWHFDFNFFKQDHHGLIAWVPFDPVGETAPGLEFCLPQRPIPAENFAAVFKNGVPPATFDEATLEQFFGPGNQRRFSPKFGPGDVALFDGFTLHRTQPMDHASTNRLAIEFRMTSATTPSERLRSEPGAGISYRLDDGTVAACSAAELYGI